MKKLIFRKTLYYGMAVFAIFVLVQGFHFFDQTSSFLESFLIFSLLSSPLLPFLLECAWLLRHKKSWKHSSLYRMRVFSPSRETDIFFYLFFMSGLLPAAIVAFPSLQISVAMREWGIGFNPDMTVHPILVGFLAYMVGSFISFFLHWSWHKIPELWKLHELHHSAEEMTVLTNYREHLLLTAMKNVFVIFFMSVLGLPLMAIGIFMALRRLQSFLLHSKINSTWGWLGKIFISPQAHRIHHLDSPAYHNQNFGFDITLWDRLFGTYMPSCPLSYEEMEKKIGLRQNPLAQEHAVVSFFSTLRNSLRVFSSRFKKMKPSSKQDAA